MKNIFNIKNKLESGYTIIETMIAISIFLLVITVGVGSLLNAHLVNKKSQNMRSILDGLNFSMEDMSRNIRTGYNYHCLILGAGVSHLELPQSCVGDNGGGYGVAFESGEGDINTLSDQWIYFVNNGKLFRSTTGDVENAIQMTPDEVVLNNDSLSFSVIGAEQNDAQQPLVVIRLYGVITSSGQKTSFSLQTAVSQRLSDI